MKNNYIMKFVHHSLLTNFTPRPTFNQNTCRKTMSYNRINELGITLIIKFNNMNNELMYFMFFWSLFQFSNWEKGWQFESKLWPKILLVKFSG